LDRFCVNSDLQDTEAVNRQSPYGAVITNDNNNIFVLTLKTFIPAGTIDIKSFGNAKPISMIFEESYILIGLDNGNLLKYTLVHQNGAIKFKSLIHVIFI